MPPVGRMLDLSSQSLHLCTQNQVKDFQKLKNVQLSIVDFEYFEAIARLRVTAKCAISASANCTGICNINR